MVARRLRPKPKLRKNLKKSYLGGGFEGGERRGEAESTPILLKGEILLETQKGAGGGNPPTGRGIKGMTVDYLKGRIKN